jgi:glucose-6-phosphate dehydrogenase assembly protein OpcA
MTTLRDTTGSAVVQALVDERRAAGAVMSGLALTLVVVVDEDHCGDAERAATAAAEMHPMRLLIVVRENIGSESRLDAEVAVGGRLGPGESVVIRVRGRLALHAESVVLPLLAPDAPVVTWWATAPPHEIAHDPLGVLAGRRITDCARDPDPMGALRNRADDYRPGDTDLAWTRTTGWRSLMASAFDSVYGTATAASVAAQTGNPSGALVAGWLEDRLRVPVRTIESDGPGITEVRVQLDSGDEIWLERGDGHNATLHGGLSFDRSLPLPRRDLGELLGEELHRLDADEPYGRALSAATGVGRLDERSPTRRHVWFDPAQQHDKGEPALYSVRSGESAGG